MVHGTRGKNEGRVRSWPRYLDVYSNERARALSLLSKPQAWDSTPMTSYFREYYWIPILAVSLYVAVIFGGKLLMSQMRPFDLRWSLALWNLGLSVFSWMGAIRTVPHLLATIGTNGVYFSMCEPACGTFGIGDVGFWTCLFIISKFPELIDTVFIVLRKKPLIFLHWYHHATVLLYCWQSFSTQNSAGIYFIAMNFTVHAIMYGYYALKAVGLWPRFIPSWIITILQLSQMIVGIVVSIMTYKFEHVDKRPCSVSYVSATSGAIMYFTYFILFLQILAKTLTKGMPKKSNKKKIE